MQAYKDTANHLNKSMMKKQVLLLGALFCSTIAFSQTGINTVTPKTTLDVAGKPADITSLDGIIAPRITGDQLRAKTYTSDQEGALVYVTAADTAPAGQTIDVTASGYYYFNGAKWVSTEGEYLNIYNANGTLTANRTVSQDGNWLRFSNVQETTFFNAAGAGMRQDAGSGNRASITFSHSGANSLFLYTDNNSAAQMLASGNSTSLNIGTNNTTNAAPLNFTTSSGGAPGTQRAQIAGDGRFNIINTLSIGYPGQQTFSGTERLKVNGRVAIGISIPTEQLHINGGNVRIQGLPLNGATNAINTTPSGSASPAQDQTFEATRTLVADNNGVVGYVQGAPSDAGTSKVLVVANASGTQNVEGQVIPNAAIGQFTVESLDIYDSWTDNVFTVPTGMGGVYIIVMQNSNTHTSIGTATPTWHTMAYYERSTDGGSSWSTIIKHTYSNLAGTIVDNGNTLYWTGFLDVGDKVRVRFSCNATTDNIVNYGGLSITKLAQ